MKPFGPFKQLQANNRLFWKPISFPNLNLDFKIEPKSWNVLSRRWISVWCRDYTVDFGHVNVPANFVIWEFVIDPDLMSDSLVMGNVQWTCPFLNSHLTIAIKAQMLCDKNCCCFESMKICLVIVFGELLERLQSTCFLSFCFAPLSTLSAHFVIHLKEKNNSKHTSWAVNGWILDIADVCFS